MIIPEEAFSGRKPNVSHFRIFGASVYCHVSKESRNKLESTTKLGVFVGYTETPHCWKIKVIILGFDSLFLIITCEC